MVDWQQHFSGIAAAYGADRFKLRRDLRNLQESEKQGRPVDEALARWLQRLEKSTARRAARVAGRPVVDFSADLPILQHRAELQAAIRDNQVVIVCGETGSGKSTQLPKLCLDLGRGIDGCIGHTQPRRIAARSLATRIAEELGNTSGTDVGFKIRFTDTTSPNSYIKLMTDGVLLAETQSDRFLNQYDTLIIDEAHERSLNVDFLLGYLKRLLQRRRDLKLIITSATIDAERFAEHFGSDGKPAPVFEVSGRTYPVEIRYRPLVADGDDDGEPDLQRSLVAAVHELAAIDGGDMLVFMPTEHDIHEAAKTLRGISLPGDRGGKSSEILPLYARLSASDQNRVFQSHSQRRIVIATNVAESSLTVPGIRFVIDPGTARLSRYSARTKIQRLPVEPVSQASVDQRAGRCGRVGPGICIRLFSEDDYRSRDRFTPPEILRTNLASVILQAEALHLGAFDEFPFLDPPKPEAIRDGYKTLHELNAMDEQRKLTPIGRQLSRLPTDPRIARIIAAGHDEGCLNEILIIAAGLELQDPRERPREHAAAADLAHQQFVHLDSDFMAYLNIWDFYHKQREVLSRNQLRKACKQNFLSENRMREWVDLHRQLLEVVQETLSWRPQPRKNDYAAIHRALLAGYLSSVACKGENREYQAAGPQTMALWPGSSCSSKPPQWIVSAEMVETHKRYLRTVAKIDPVWIEPLAMHLVQRTYSEPHWSRDRGSVSAYEKVSLFGLTVVARRRVQYGRIDPVASRALFIQHALVEGDFDTQADFLTANQLLREEVLAELTKLRRLDLLRDEESALEYYERIIPADVYDGPRFEKWRKEVEKTNPELLHLPKAALVHDDAPTVAAGQYPDALAAGSVRLPVSYRCEPGHNADGVSLKVPLQALNQVDDRRVEWLVPGLLEEKITAVIRALPKALRTRFVPAPDVARQVAGRLKFGEGTFAAAVAAALTAIGREPVPVEAVRNVELPDYLRLNIQVVDAAGKVVAEKRDLAALRSELGATATRTFSAGTKNRWTKDGLTAWDFEDLPVEVSIPQAGVELKGVPAIVDQQQAVGIRLFDTADVAAAAHREGLRRLFVLQGKRDIKTHLDWLPGFDKVMIHAAVLSGPRDFRAEVAELLAERGYFATGPMPRSKSQFDAALRAGRGRLGIAAQEVASLLPGLLLGFFNAKLSAERLVDPRWKPAVDDSRLHLKELTRPGFLVRTPWEWLVHYPRYFQGVQRRLEKLPRQGLAADQKSLDQLRPFVIKLKAVEEQSSKQYAAANPAQLRWMLEEFRVSLFAQELGTAVPVSAKRLQACVEKLVT